MFIRNLQVFVDDASDCDEFGVAVCSIETGKEIATTFDVAADIDEHGRLIFNIAIEFELYNII